MNMRFIEGEITPQEIKLVREWTYRNQPEVQWGRTQRGLFRRPQTSWTQSDIEGYNDVLPKVEGLDFVGQVNLELQTKQRQLKLLDIGCGSGQFLVDASQNWGDLCEYYGINAFSYPLLDSSWLNKTGKNKEELGIQIRTGDIQDLRKEFPEGKFDVAVSVAVGMYLADPWATIKGMHDVLRVGGLGLVTQFPLYNILPKQDSEKFKEYLENNGFKIYPRDREMLCDMTFRKMDKELEFPLQPALIAVDEADPHESPYFLYRMREGK